mmetsp:Transcript_19912/g.27769  ORF Transcript_19912/g.27769 Transcript_19912/m.27769 type:complete len:195 (+) Transcript_19912:16-600(+)|eukprot:CAMPEP_0184484116 /NCGR_PEP_ID=MMETSP0113_2-20130426/5831_1 /TAXON_ID=91329 /ORGANISM="Norrisiella sphaerica, Strain BC52" /LENGTH=194 /DNA_ID=CAMNT_0026864933 /DNA_START=16 /DNA_END=600 /DNA_ORIENTATION=-
MEERVQQKVEDLSLSPEPKEKKEGKIAGPVTAKNETQGPPVTLAETRKSAMMKKIRSGFKIVHMDMTDVESGDILWQSTDWNDIFTAEKEIVLPKKVHETKTVSRTMKFSTKEAIQSLRLVQKVLLHGQVLEVWNFKFGFAIPNSTNSWQCVIESAGDDKMIPIHILSGNIKIETQFFDDESLIAKSTLRVLYK